MGATFFILNQWPWFVLSFTFGSLKPFSVTMGRWGCLWCWRPLLIVPHWFYRHLMGLPLLHGGCLLHPTSTNTSTFWKSKSLERIKAEPEARKSSTKITLTDMEVVGRPTATSETDSDDQEKPKRGWKLCFSPKSSSLWGCWALLDRPSLGHRAIWEDHVTWPSLNPSPH